MDNLFIRLYQPEDELAVVTVWHRAGQAAYTFLPMWQMFTLEEAKVVFRKSILAHCDIWVGIQAERIVAYLAMKDSYIDRLYIDPLEQRQGWGTRLVNFAKQRSPCGLELHTHQENHAARGFYEKHSFVAVKFGISPAPESAPDVKYHWRP
jgi:putative acetyltransferase